MIDRPETPERLVAYDPRAAELRIRDELDVLAECAVVVHPHRTGEKDAIAPGHLLLDEEAKRRVRDVVLAAFHVGGGGGRR